MCAEYAQLHLEQQILTLWETGTSDGIERDASLGGRKWLFVSDKRGVLQLSSLTGITLEDVTVSE